MSGREIFSHMKFRLKKERTSCPLVGQALFPKRRAYIYMLPRFYSFEEISVHTSDQAPIAFLWKYVCCVPFSLLEMWFSYTQQNPKAFADSISNCSFPSFFLLQRLLHLNEGGDNEIQNE